MADFDTAPPLNYAVLVTVPPGAYGEPPQTWTVIYANGDMASARAKAEEWAAAHPGEQAVVVQYADHVQIVAAPKWAKA